MLVDKKLPVPGSNSQASNEESEDDDEEQH